ncbi:MAG: hypothetical protein WC740_19915 [Verrucomicrobiia bacterium]
MHVHNKTRLNGVLSALDLNERCLWPLEGVTPVCFIITAIAFIHVVRGDFDGIVRSRR